MNKITTAFFLLFSAIAFSQTYSGPESAEYDYANSRWLIANTTSHEVLARSSSGVLTVFASGLVSGPYGIEIVGNVLYCCSGASVKGYSLATGANVFNLNVGATFLNGMTHDNSGNLYATDFSAKKIFKINTTTQAFSAIASSLVQSPNGIVFDQTNNRCVFVNWGASAPIKAIDISTNVVTTLLSTSLSNIDGITRDGAGNYYIATWGGQNVLKYDSAFANPATSVTTGLSNPADLFYNTVNNVLAIPNSGNNTVTFLDLSLGTNEFNSLNALAVFPNPANNEAFVKFDGNEIVSASYEIVNIEGKVVATTNLGEISNGQFSVDTSKFPTGVYYLTLKANGNSKTISLLVAH